jgi:hypothetical protein
MLGRHTDTIESLYSLYRNPVKRCEIQVIFPRKKRFCGHFLMCFLYLCNALFIIIHYYTSKLG